MVKGNNQFKSLVLCREAEFLVWHIYKELQFKQSLNPDRFAWVFYNCSPKQVLVFLVCNNFTISSSSLRKAIRRQRTKETIHYGERKTISSLPKQRVYRRYDIIPIIEKT